MAKVRLLPKSPVEELSPSSTTYQNINQWEHKIGFDPMRTKVAQYLKHNPLLPPVQNDVSLKMAYLLESKRMYPLKIDTSRLRKDLSK